MADPDISISLVGGRAPLDQELLILLLTPLFASLSRLER
jgi:hypothetical protein